MKAIIRALNSGAHFLADYGPHGFRLSMPLPVKDASETGEIDWARFEDANTRQVHRGDASHWQDDRFAVVHRFD